MATRRYRTRSFIPLSLAVLLASPAFAGLYSWNTGSGEWTNPANWSPAVFPNAPDDSALFQNPGALVTVASPVTLGSLAFDNVSGGYTLNPLGAGALTLSSTTSNASILITAAVASNTILAVPLNLASSTVVTNNSTLGAFTMSGALSGPAALTLSGPGPITLSGSSAAWAGNLFINAAAVTASGANALGTGIATINSGATLTFNNTTSKTFTLNGGTLNSNSPSTVTLGGTLTLTADSAITTTSPTRAMQFGPLAGNSNLSLTNGIFILTGNSGAFGGSITLGLGATAQLTGGLTGAQLVTVATSSSFTVSRPAGINASANSLAPGVVLVQGGDIGVAANVDFRPLLAPGSVLGGILINAANTTLSTNALDLNDFANASTLRIAGNGSIASTVDVRPDTATHTFRFGLPSISSTLTVNATLADHDAAPASLDLNAGGLTLTTANAYTGLTTITAATLQINNALGLGAGSGSDADGTIVNNAAILRLAAGVTLSGEKVTVNPGGTLNAVNLTGTYANPIVMNGGTLGAATFTGPLNGTGNFFVSGSTLAGIGAYSGTATLTGNTLLNGSSALSPTGTSVISSGTTTIAIPFAVPLILNGGQISLNSSITMTSSLTVNAGTLTAANVTGTYAGLLTMNGGALGTGNFSGQIAGSGNFNISGSVLSGTGAYTGTATFSGNATVSSSAAFSATGSTVVSSGIVTITTAVNAPLQMNGGSVTATAPMSSLFTVTGGRLTQAPGGSFANQSVILAGGLLSLTGNLSIHDMLHPASSGGVISIDSANFTSGADNAIDFSTLPGGGGLSLGAILTGSIAAGVSLAPDTTTHTLRFGGPGLALGSLTLNPIVADIGGIPTNITLLASSALILPTSNTYSGITTVSGTLLVNDPLALGAGTGVDADGTVLNNGGKLAMAPGVTLTNEKITAFGGTLTGSSNGPLQINGPIVLSGSFAGPISGSGNFSTNASLTLSGHNSFTGSLTIASPADVLVTTSDGLGSTSAGTILNSGNLTLATATSEPITMFGGTFNVNANYLGSLTMTGGTTYFNATTFASASIAGGNFNVYFPNSGAITLSGGSANILAQTSGPILMSGGILNFQFGGSSPITVTGGTVTLTNANNNSGHVAIANAVVQLTSPFLTFPLVISGNSFLTGTSGSHLPSINASGILIITDASTFSTPFTFSGLMIENGTTQFSSLVSSGHLTFNGSVTVTTSLGHAGDIVARSNLTLNGLASANHLTLVGGTLAGNAALILSDHLQVNGGTLNFTGSLAGGTQMDIVGGQVNALQLPVVGTINVLAGELRLHSSISLTTTSIKIVSGATLSAQSSFSLSNFINLNSPETGYKTAYLNMFGNTFSGAVNLGPADASVQIQGGATFAGGVSGGRLDVMAGGDVTFLSGTNTFAGMTLTGGPINGSIYNATVRVKSALALTGPITLGVYSGLYIDNSAATVSDRIADNVPINMNGGWLELDPTLGPGHLTSETLGTLTLVSGLSRIAVQGAGATSGTNTVILSINSLNRNEGAVLDLQDTANWYYPARQLGGAVDGPHLLIANQAPTSFLGGAYIYAIDPNPFTATNFLKYSSTLGVVPLASSDYYAGPESTWVDGLVPFIPKGTTVTLTASRAITALKMETNDSASGFPTLDLAGFTLNVTSGGLLMPYASVITGSPGNRLTAGGSAPSAELFFHSVGYGGNITISANITDNPGPDGQYDLVPGGPLDADNGKVSVVFSEYNQYVLSGNNTYTGTTYIDGIRTDLPAIVICNTASSVPKGPISVSIGSLILNAGLAVTGPVTLREGVISGGGINATSYQIESGTITSAISGSGPITKTSFGTGSVAIGPTFTGSISALGGLLALPGGTFNNALIIQNATVQVNDAAVTFTGPITMGDNSSLVVLDDFGFQQATLNFSPSSLTVGSNATISFQGFWAAGGAGDPFTDTSNPSRHLNVVMIPHAANSPGATFSVTAGTKNLAQLIVPDGGATISAGASLIVDSIRLTTSLSVSGAFALRPGASGDSHINALSIAGTTNAWTGVVDIANRALVVEPTANRAAAITQLQNQITSGKHGGDWLGKGITSSVAAANPSHFNILLLDNTIYHLDSFAGSVGNVDDNSIIITLAHLGDANLNGLVDIQDLTIVANNWQKHANLWTQGDLNGDGIVDIQDLTIVANNWQQSSSFPLNPSALTSQDSRPTNIPEPSSFSLLLALIPLLPRNRRPRPQLL